MISVTDTFSANEADRTRSISHMLQVAWKKDYRPDITYFTIGVSIIGGNDVIAGASGADSDWNKYVYNDESNYVIGLEYERELNEPTGGLVKALASAKLDNTSGRFTPRYAGGNSELFTAVAKPRRPFIINAGFHYDGIDNNIPQFVGITTKTPQIDSKSKTVSIQGADFTDFLQNRYVDNESMFTGLRTDEVIENILINSGYSTSQYELDTGINIINFGEFKIGDKFGDIINKVVQAENGNFYQNEEGKLIFQNRQAWTEYPYYDVQRVISTGQVIEARTPSTDHIINVVEVKGKPRGKQPNQLVFTLSGTKELAASTDTEIFINFDDPMLAIDNPVFVANTDSSGSGTDVTSSVAIKSFNKFARAAKLVLTNNTAQVVYITAMTIYGRPAKVLKDIYVRRQRDISVTAYEEQPFLIENEYIGDESWAESYSEMILNDYALPENLTELTIRAIPELQFGDLVSWQGRYWRVYGIKTKIDPGSGFIQELKLLQRTIQTYFRIGISTIGGEDVIAP